MTERFDDQIVVVTGASSGIGAGFAREFHARGAQVVLIARREERLKDLCAELNARREGSARYLVANLAGAESSSIIEFLRSSRVDVLVSNAGRGSFGYFESQPLESEVEMVELNALAPLKLMHAVIPQMKERGRGVILSVSSLANFAPLPYMATYAATKAFNFSHALGLRNELTPFGVRVLAICPGPVATEFGGVARVPGKLTGVVRDSVESVVQSSMCALAGDRGFVVPGLRSKLSHAFLWLLPTTWATYLVGRTLKSTLDYMTTNGATRESKT